MTDLVIVGCCLGVALILLFAERVWIERVRRAVPVRVAVMGMRGKSSVVRLIAAGLRGGGHSVIYKTTGSRAIIGLPQADEIPIRRRSLPTPLEQRRVLHLSRRSRADTLVVETMSIRAESLRVELASILAPRVVALTAFREDHLSDLPDPIRAFADAPPRRAVVISAPDIPDELRRRMIERGLAVHAVDPDSAAGHLQELPYPEWPVNLAIALDVCERLGVPSESALDGMRTVMPDVGALAAWQLDLHGSKWCIVNGFAANDPASTRLVLERSLDRWAQPGDGCVGLLNLRSDRGDRTEQWLRTLGHGNWPFDDLAVVGAVPWALARQLRRVLGEVPLIVRSGAVDVILEKIHSLRPNGGVLFGFGNMGGPGGKLVEWCRQKGEPLR